MTGSQDKYFTLYKQYKDIMVEKEDKRLIKNVLPISETLKNKLMEFFPCRCVSGTDIFYMIIILFIGSKKISMDIAYQKIEK